MRKTCMRTGCQCPPSVPIEAYGVLAISLCFGCHLEMQEDQRMFDGEVRTRALLTRKFEIRKAALAGPCASVEACDATVGDMMGSDDRLRELVRAWLTTPARHQVVDDIGSLLGATPPASKPS